MASPERASIHRQAVDHIIRRAWPLLACHRVTSTVASTQQARATEPPHFALIAYRHLCNILKKTVLTTRRAEGSPCDIAGIALAVVPGEQTNQRSPREETARREVMTLTWFDVYWFFRRKARIAFLTALTYAALC
jgi:hypothetical protein